MTSALEVSKELDKHINTVTGTSLMQGFERAHYVSQAIVELKKLLTPEYMKPIMAMQNSRLGFLTDRPAGYDETTVKNCLIDAVLSGFQPYGNQFNIISGNFYGTKEGFGSVLGKITNLKWSILPGLPRINAEKTSGAVQMTIKWSINGEQERQEVIDFGCVLHPASAKPDMVIGKCTRKARAWLFSQITGIEAGDGDLTQDIPHEDLTAINYETLCDMYEDKKERLLPAERTRAQRILALDKDDQPLKDGKPETNSFKKLRDQLVAL